MNGRVVLVTGGSQGIGRAAVASLARRGAKLVVVSREPDARHAADEVARVVGEAGTEGIHVAADVTCEADVERCVAAALERFGRLDAAFNNASAGKGVLSALADFTTDDFDEAIADSLKSVWLCMRAEIRAMKRNATDGGAIVNTASVNGLGAAPMGALYSAAKAGVIALSKAGALDYATDGIRVNALVPGAVDTRMLGGALDRIARRDRFSERRHRGLLSRADPARAPRDGRGARGGRVLASLGCVLLRDGRVDRGRRRNDGLRALTQRGVP